MLCVIVAATLTWAAHSSVATVLLIMSLAYSSFVTPTAALALVLGANLGSAINPLLEGARRGDPASYRLPLGNLLNRLTGILLVLPFLQPIAEELLIFQPDTAKMTAQFHIAFNIALALVSFLFSIPSPRCWRRYFRRGHERTIPSFRDISTRAPLIRLRSPWRMPRARRCEWAIPSR